MTKKNTDLARQPAIHPAEITDKYLLTRQSIHRGAFIVEHLLTPPDECELSSLTHHFLSIQLNDGNTRQVNRHDVQEYDGQFPRGSLFLLPAGVPAFWHWEATDEALAVSIHPTFLQQTALETDCLNPNKLELLNTLIARDCQLESIALLFKHEIETNAVGSSLYAESLANVLAVHLLRNYCVFQPKIQTYEGGLPKYKLKQLLDYINANLDQDIKLANLAQVVGMSQYYFCQLFKQSMGIAPYQYVIQQRVERAKQLLKCREIAIIDVALECGFANQSHFTKHFRKLTGITPKAYRER
jgi:AraC family transcriptional regulator